MIKLDVNETHDRYKHFTNQDFSILECCEDLIKKEPFGKRPFYIFAHSRTDDDGVRKRLIWQPRLTRPTSQTNSMLFKVYPGSDRVDIIWMIPSRELWSQFEDGKVSESHIVRQSIDAFENNRVSLDTPSPDDPSDDQVRHIYSSLIAEKQNKDLLDRLWLEKTKIIKPMT